MKASRLPLTLCLVMLLAAVCRAQFFTLPGTFSYSLNSVNQVFDISPDAKIAVALRNDPNTVHPAFLTTFDPLTGAQFDSKSFGFGPLGVQLARVGDSLRAVVLTSEGGPRRIYLFDISAAGKLTQLASTQLTTSNADAGSNIVLSGQAAAGFTLTADGKLVAFSLTDGSILQNFPASGVGTLLMSEAAGKRVLAFGGSTITFVDAANPAQMATLGTVALPGGSDLPGPGMAFSPDGRYLFAGNSSTTLSAIDVTTRQVVGTLSGGGVYGRVRVHDDGQRRLLAVVVSGVNTNQSSVIIVDATDVANMSVKGQYAAPFSYKSDLQFTPDGARLFAVTVDRLIALEVPTLALAWEKVLPASPTREHQLMTYGQPAEVLAAWQVFNGANFISMFGSFPAYLPDVTVSDASAAEGAAADFTFTLSAPTTHKVTVSYQTSNGTAVSPADYAGISASLVFQPGETTKTVSVQSAGDTTDEFDETFKMNLTNVDVGLAARAQGTATLFDDDPPPTITVNDRAAAEGDAGAKAVALEVLLSEASGKPVTVSYATADGTATSGTDYAPASSDIMFNPGETRKLVTVNINGDTAVEPDETVLFNLTAPVNATLARAQGMLVILNDDPTVQFDVSGVTVTEGTDHSVTLNVTRASDLSTETTVSYETLPGTASDRSDYTAAYGKLHFAPNESAKSITVFITDDARGEPQETFAVRLFGATGGGIGARSVVIVRINSDEAADGPNPVREASFDPQFFVRQHYHDFLNREPDAEGLQFWTKEITKCGSDALCLEVKKINVSAAFFLSIEFQETGYLAYRTYKAAYGDAVSPNVAGTVPVIRLREFLADARRIGQGVQVNVGDWRQQLEANKDAYALEFVQAQRFRDAYPTSMTAEEFVTKLDQNAGGVLTPAEKSQLAALLSPNAADEQKRAAVLRAVAEDAQLRQAELNRAFVLMQYYGYLRRNPDDPQDADFRGWKFWLDKLNQFQGNFVQAEMVKAFISSDEYQKRFGQ